MLLVGFIMLAIPLVQLTTARESVAAPQVQIAESKTVPTTLRLRYAHQPSKLSLQAGGKDLIVQPDLTSSPLELAAELVIPKDGLELSLKAEWPAGTPDTALTVEIEPDGLDARNATRWSTGPSLEEVIPFVWKP